MISRKITRILSGILLSVILLCCCLNANAAQPAFSASFIKDELNQFTGLKIAVESQTANITGLKFDIVVSEGITVTGRRLTMAGWSISGTTAITLTGPAARIVTVFVYFNVDPELPDNPTISINNILVRTTGGNEYLSNQTLTVMLHEETHVHTYSIFQVIEPTVCGQHGKIVYMCECGETYEEETAELEHQPTGVFITLIEATCAQEGIKAQYCELCGTTLLTESIPPAGHQPAEAYTVILEPTCTGEGEQAQLCLVCGIALNNRQIPPVGHQPAESFTVITAPTCTLEGEQAQLCRVCGTELVREPIPASGHQPAASFTVISDSMRFLMRLSISATSGARASVVNL